MSHWIAVELLLLLQHAGTAPAKSTSSHGCTPARIPQEHLHLQWAAGEEVPPVRLLPPLFWLSPISWLPHFPERCRRRPYPDALTAASLARPASRGTDLPVILRGKQTDLHAHGAVEELVPGHPRYCLPGRRRRRSSTSRGR
jgi:hypothetical protein